MLSAEEYERLKRRHRRNLKLEEPDAGFLRALEAADVPAEHAHLYSELKDWIP